MPEMAEAETLSPFEHVVILGAGRVGSFFADLLAASGATVALADIRPEPAVGAAPGRTHHLVHDATRPPEGEIRAVLTDADLVVLSLPSAVIKQALRQVMDVARPAALVVDTSSVLYHLGAVWASPTAGQVPHVVGMNPMFAPGIGVRGRPVLLVDPRGPNPAGPLWRLLEGWGLGVIPLESAEQHDVLCAALQATVHAAVLAVGSALAATPFTARELLAAAPPPCRIMLLMLARLGSQSPDVYSDIQSVNPFAANARDSLSAAIAALRGDTQDSVTEIIRDLQEWLGESAAPLADECGRIFSMDIMRNRVPSVFGAGSEEC
jgi:4-amino-4-deoxyprephenate dehydrogenase